MAHLICYYSGKEFREIQQLQEGKVAFYQLNCYMKEQALELAHYKWKGGSLPRGYYMRGLSCKFLFGNSEKKGTFLNCMMPTKLSSFGGKKHRMSRYGFCLL